MSAVDPLQVERDDGTVVANGAKYPNGSIVVMWDREAFPPEERTGHNVVSLYADIEDAEQATGGDVVFLE